MDCLSQTTILTKLKPAGKRCSPDWPLNSLKPQTSSSSSTHTDVEESWVEKCFKLWISAKLFGINLRHEVTVAGRKLSLKYISLPCLSEKCFYTIVLKKTETFVTFFSFWVSACSCTLSRESLVFLHIEALIGHSFYLNIQFKTI